MGSSNVRQIEVFKTANPEQILTIKGLAVKEKELVVSHIIASQAWRDNVINHPDKDLRVKLIFPFAKDNTISEQDVIDYFADLGITGLSFKNSITGNFLKSVEAVAVTPATATVAADSTQQFNAAVTPAGANPNVTWSVADNGEDVTVDENGLVTVAAGVAAGDYDVTATSVEDNTKTDTAVLTVS